LVSTDKLRVGDAERDDALRTLAEHLAAGRLDIEEHSERSSQIISARTRGDIRKVFVDLPEPHPDLSGSATVGAGGSGPGRGSLDRHSGGTSGQVSLPDGKAAARRRRGAAVRAFASGLTPFVWCVCIAVFVMTSTGWWMFLVPIAYSALLSAWSQASGDQHPDIRHDKASSSTQSGGGSDSSGGRRDTSDGDSDTGNQSNE
jgi:hypothetical protein